jgi:hypothetical protein
MAKRNAGRRGRARRRRSAATAGEHDSGGGAADQEGGGEPGDRERRGAQTGGRETATAQASRRERPRAAARRAQEPAGRDRARRDPGGVGERPQAPWHPWPFSELLILAGAIATIIGFTRGEPGHTVLFAGIGAVVLGTLEFTIREHLSGYRAHTSLLAAVPTALFHGAMAFALYEAGAPRETWVLVPVVLDVPLFWFLFRTLRARFEDARRERVFQLGRR